MLVCAHFDAQFLRRGDRDLLGARLRYFFFFWFGSHNYVGLVLSDMMP